MKKVFFKAFCYLLILQLALCRPSFNRKEQVDRLDKHYGRRLFLNDWSNKHFDKRIFLDEKTNKHFDRRLFLDNNESNKHFDRRLFMNGEESNRHFDRRLFLDDNESNKHFDRRLFLDDNESNKHFDRRLFLDEEFSGDSKNTNFENDDESGDFDDVNDGSGGFNPDDFSNNAGDFSGNDVSSDMNFSVDCITKNDNTGFSTILKKIVLRAFRGFNKNIGDDSN